MPATNLKEIREKKLGCSVAVRTLETPIRPYSSWTALHPLHPSQGRNHKTQFDSTDIRSQGPSMFLIFLFSLVQNFFFHFQNKRSGESFNCIVALDAGFHFIRFLLYSVSIHTYIVVYTFFFPNRWLKKMWKVMRQQKKRGRGEE